MTITFLDRAKETTTDTGLYALNLDGPMPGFLGLPTTGEIYYCILADDGSEWEVGSGSVTEGPPNFLGRHTVYNNHLGIADKVDFSPGTKHVFCVAPAQHHLQLQGMLDASMSGRGMGSIDGGVTEGDTPGSLLVNWPVPFSEACGISFLFARYAAFVKKNAPPFRVKAWEGTFTITADAVTDFTKEVVSNPDTIDADLTGVALSSGDILFDAVGTTGSTEEWIWTIRVDVSLSAGNGC